MSHFNVAVFSKGTDQVDALLAPYIEQVEPDSPYAEFVESEEGEKDSITGKKGYWHNPNARWDWYVIGGRWRGQLKLLKGKVGSYGFDYTPEERAQFEKDRCDMARAVDCDYSPDEEAYKKALRFWEIAVEGKPAAESEKDAFLSFYKPEYFIRQYGTKENYARWQSAFLPYAFITQDGEWFETGRMGWWGMDDSTAESREAYQKAFEAYLEQAKAQDLVITIVDCHI